MSFRLWIDAGEVKTITEGLFIMWAAMVASVDGEKITSHAAHKAQSCAQGRKHHKFLHDKHEWSNKAQSSAVDWEGLKPGFLPLGPLK